MPISLKPHNVETYQKVTDKLKESNKVAVIHPTGTGKMYIALKLLEENKGKKTIYIAPSNPILHDVKKNIYAEGMTMSEFPKLKRITYQKLARLTDEEIQELDADIIVLDEFHHCGAPEWGKGVQRLLQRNEGASVLGLSATPLRYTDGLRDMADELFENNIASEMTLEEAIQREILPKATYVSTLYGYDKELQNMQTNIDKIKDDDKRQEAQDLLNNLREKLDANTQNLPQLFSEHMQNKSGKYIIFCKDIDDMNEKVEQAQKMFGGVNTNITIRGVSSKIKESDKILTEFEQDSEEGTLKLLYAVDMLNEGYHIKNLDGVVMMRPTFSPTIYTQQLGRALTVGGDKVPVVLDLVNNFDSCKIIEDFAERMRKYKGNEGTGKTEQDKKSRLSIFDKTKEFRDIAEKITELSKRSKVTLEQKIEIFERFMQTGEELLGSTTFEGYPIGLWATQIRSGLNRMNKGKDDRVTINPTEKQIEKLESMGILERQIDSTIEEKIDALIEWNKKYPQMRLDHNDDLRIMQYDKDFFMRYFLEEEERWLKIHDEVEMTTDERYDRLENIAESFKKLQGYYQYVRYRKYSGKLTEEQISRCKEGNVRGAFGYPESTEKIARDYKQNVESIDDYISRFGSIDEAIAVDFNTHGLIRDCFEINLNNNDEIESLLGHIYENSKIVYNCDNVLEQLNELPEKYRNVLMEYYGINGTERKKTAEISQEMGVSRSAVHDYIKRACELLRKKDLGITFIPHFNEIGEEDRKKIVEALGNYVFIPSIEYRDEALTYSIDNLNELVNICKEIKKYGTVCISDEEKEKIDLEAQIENLQEQVETSGIPIEQLSLTVKVFNILARAGIKTVEEIINIDEENGLERIRNLGKHGIEEIREKTAVYREIIVEDREIQREDLARILPEDPPKSSKKRFLETPLKELDLSVRTFNCLGRKHIYKLQDLLHRSKEELSKIRGLGKGSIDEIILKLEEYGIVCNENGELELELELEDSQDEVETIDEDTETIEIEEEKSELELLREKRDQLLEKQKRIQERIAQAKELSASYDRLNGNLQENEIPNLYDE